MRVLNYLELEGRLGRSGIGTAAAHQQKALSGTGVEVLTSPWRAPRGAAPNPIREFDVAHCNLFGPGSLAVVRTARSRGCPLILHAHVTAEDFARSFRGSTLLAGPLRRYLQWFYSKADCVLCPSAYTRRVLEGYPVHAPVEAVTNGVDVESLRGFESLREAYRDRYGLSGTVVFAVGNVFERKGLSTFCRLAQETAFEFAWFGPYDAGPHASAPVRRWTRNPPENVTFTGWVDDKRGAFAAGDVFCLPTHVENQGIAVLEAMACGKPVVLRDIPVFDEFFTHGEDCLKCSTLAEFQEALERLDADPTLREQLGAHARKTAAEHGLDRVAERLLSLYGSLLDE